MTADPRDLRAAFGGATVDGDFVTIFKAKTEADLRRSLATVAHAYGWDVSEEVVIPGWGRIDLVLRAHSTYLIELKIDLTRPARIRRAFQQADGYGRWWAENRGRATDVFLVGSQMDAAAVGPVARAYPTVGVQSISELLTFFEFGGGADALSFRAIRSTARALAACEVNLVYAQARKRMRERALLEEQQVKA